MKLSHEGKWLSNEKITTSVLKRKSNGLQWSEIHYWEEAKQQYVGLIACQEQCFPFLGLTFKKWQQGFLVSLRILKTILSYWSTWEQMTHTDTTLKKPKGILTNRTERKGAEGTEFFVPLSINRCDPKKEKSWRRKKGYIERASRNGYFGFSDHRTSFHHEEVLARDGLYLITTWKMFLISGLANLIWRTLNKIL